MFKCRTADVGTNEIDCKALLEMQCKHRSINKCHLRKNGDGFSKDFDMVLIMPKLHHLYRHTTTMNHYLMLLRNKFIKRQITTKKMDLMICNAQYNEAGPRATTKCYKASGVERSIVMKRIIVNQRV